MSTQDTFNGAKSGLTFMRAYVNIVAQEIGAEKALVLDTKVSEALGAMNGKMIKEQLGDREIGAKEASQVLLMRAITIIHGKYSLKHFTDYFFNKDLKCLLRGYNQTSLIGTLIFPGGPSFPLPLVCPTLRQFAAL